MISIQVHSGHQADVTCAMSDSRTVFADLIKIGKAVTHRISAAIEQHR